jgi:hypothetical protein
LANHAHRCPSRITPSARFIVLTPTEAGVRLEEMAAPEGRGQWVLGRRGSRATHRPLPTDLERDCTG